MPPAVLLDLRGRNDCIANNLLPALRASMQSIVHLELRLSPRYFAAEARAPAPNLRHLVLGTPTPLGCPGEQTARPRSPSLPTSSQAPRRVFSAFSSAAAPLLIPQHHHARLLAVIFPENVGEDENEGERAAPSLTTRTHSYGGSIDRLRIESPFLFVLKPDERSKCIVRVDYGQSGKRTLDPDCPAPLLAAITQVMRHGAISSLEMDVGAFSRFRQCFADVELSDTLCIVIFYEGHRKTRRRTQTAPGLAPGARGH
ncbi:hypothetical protein AURDEDRAFT_161409 [Auricularia subglabra TFB-10046 SS5]|nr:hypothetical protein AURDEDRAFT_161409 [Auricularia subglabra TFB-10046 SS5]